ncbi:MAG: L-serine ammonia-lyase [Pseudomonadota bacterium]
MSISVFDIFKIGIGPSSSHTMGPMNAAREFASGLLADGLLGDVNRVEVLLFGSLALTGRGHCTDRAVLLGLEGAAPATIDPDTIEPVLARIRGDKCLRLAGERDIAFEEANDLVFIGSEQLPRHPNGMRFVAFSAERQTLRSEEYYSIGGGFITRGEASLEQVVGHTVQIKYPFHSASELLNLAEADGLRLDQLAMVNETAWRTEDQVNKGLDQIWQVMQNCVQRGMSREDVLPGSLAVRRRAAKLAARLLKGDADKSDWVNVFAMAVNEENAAGGKVVTSPTNGAAGIVPAVLHYYWQFVDGADIEGVRRFLLVAGTIGMLYKMNASISGAEMGCQGEVGVACSMAAAGLVAAKGGSNTHIENAAEIGMEHNLGLTCDPIAGLVQIPCIERNAMGAVKAINATRMAMHGDGVQKVSLDQVIATMRQTGEDMSHRYKETSLGGLAVNVIEC